MVAARAAETMLRLEELGADTLWVVYHNYGALSQGKVVPRHRFADVAQNGVTFARANWDFAMTDDQLPHAGFAADSGDFRVVPDPDTIVAMAHRPGVAQAYGWLADADLEPWAGDPRGRLRAAVATLAARGIEVSMAFETEFVLAARDGSDWVPSDRSRMFVIDEVDARWPWVADVLGSLDAAGIPVHQFAKEYGPAQYELSFLPTDPVAAVDQFLLARQLVKALAGREGLSATFMPRPWTDLPANGVHVHVSLTGGDGRALIPDPVDPSALSETGRQAVAGLLDHSAALCALTAPSPNSYRRLQPGSWAPAHRCWGFGNRAALVRVPGTGDGRHLEYRLADATANPYLLATGILAAIDDGLERRLEPPPPATVDVGHLEDDEALAAGFDRLPSDPLAALAALEADAVLREALGPVIPDHYQGVKRFEAELASAAERDAADGGAAWHRWCWLETV